jgi:predicted ATPase
VGYIKKNKTMQIKTLEIANFKKFKNLEVPFGDINCLVGGNNSGKSTTLQALALFDFCLHQCLSQTNGKPITLKNRSITEEDFVVLPVAKGTDLWHDKITLSQNKHVLIHIKITFDNDKCVETKLDFNFNRFSITTETDTNPEWLNQLKDFKVSYLPVFSTFQTKEEKRTSLAVRNELSKGNVNSVIRNLLLSLKEKKEEQKLIDLLKRAFPEMKHMTINFDEAAQQYIDVTYKEENKKKEFDIFSAGSGFQQFIYLFGFIFLEEPNVILLDEPDVHLHGTLQTQLYTELKKLVETEKKQVVLATHSRDLITALPPEIIISIASNNAIKLTDDFQVFSVLGELGSLDNTELITLQEFRRVLIVENKDDWKWLQAFGKAILGETEMQQIAKRLTVFYTYGNPTSKDLHTLRKQLQDGFKNQEKQIEIFAIADNDYFPETQELIDDLQSKERNFNESTKNYIQWHIWQRAEIENYWLRPQIFNRLLVIKSTNNQRNLDDLTLDNAFDKFIAGQKDDIEGRLMKGYETYSKTFKKNWDSTTCLQKAKERLKTIWQEPLDWIDAKKINSNVNKYFQEKNLKTFSIQTIMDNIQKEDLPQEVGDLFNNLRKFAGIIQKYPSTKSKNWG